MSIEVPKSRNMRYVPALSKVYRPHVASLSLGNRDLVHFSGNKPAKEKKEGWLKRLWNFLMTPFRWFASLFRKKKAKTEDTKAESSQTSDKKSTSGTPPVQESPPVTSEKGQVEVDSAVSAPEPKPTQTGASMSLTELFGPDLSQVTLRQRSGNTCYILALLDNVLNHPQGRQMLESIPVRKTDKGYEVQLVGKTVHVSEEQLEQNKPNSTVVESKAVGIPILEQAYLESLPGSKRHDIGETADVLDRLFPTELQPPLESFNWVTDTNTNPNYKHNLQNLIREVKSDGQKLPLLVALRKDDPMAFNDSCSDHYYSVRLKESNENDIVVRDPFKPAQNTILPINAFVKDFQLMALGKAIVSNIESYRRVLESCGNAKDFAAEVQQQINHPDANLDTLRAVFNQDIALKQRCRQECPAAYEELFPPESQ